MSRPPTVTKADLTEAIYELGDYTKREAAEFVDLIFETMKDVLEDGTKIKLSGFGNFEVRHKDARPGRNPQTKEEMIIAARRVLKFKPSQKLKDRLNAEPLVIDDDEEDE